MSHYDEQMQKANEAMEQAIREERSVSIQETLKQRGDRYGSFEDNSQLTQALHQTAMQFYFKNHPNEPMPPYIVEGLHMILHKVSRAVCGDVMYSDNFEDIAGYATRVAEILNKPTQPK